MKFILQSLLAAGLFLAGCKREEAASTRQTNAPSGGNPLTAPVDYLGAAGRAQRSASKTISGAALDQAIRIFFTEKGRFPNDLKELIPQYISTIPPAPAGMKYNYDPKTGAVELTPQ